MSEFSKRSLLTYCVLAFVATVGCNDQSIPTYPVAGTVEFADGTPVSFGHIELYNKQHDLTARGKIQSDGTFELGTFTADDGAVAGTHSAIVVQVIMPGQLDGGHHDHGRHAARRYADFSTSGLEVIVSSDEPNQPIIKLEP